MGTTVKLGAATVSSAAALGALFGGVHCVYDCANYSTSRQWPLVLTLADTTWAALAAAPAAAIVRIVAR
jgi:uncharacterized membrane protein